MCVSHAPDAFLQRTNPLTCRELGSEEHEPAETRPLSSVSVRVSSAVRKHHDQKERGGGLFQLTTLRPHSITKGGQSRTREAGADTEAGEELIAGLSPPHGLLSPLLK